MPGIERRIFMQKKSKKPVPLNKIDKYENLEIKCFYASKVYILYINLNKNNLMNEILK